MKHLNEDKLRKAIRDILSEYIEWDPIEQIWKQRDLSGEETGASDSLVDLQIDKDDRG